MGRGYLAGLVWGIIVGGLGLAAISLVDSRGLVGSVAPEVSADGAASVAPGAGDEGVALPSQEATTPERDVPAQPEVAGGEALPGADTGVARPESDDDPAAGAGEPAEGAAPEAVTAGESAPVISATGASPKGEGQEEPPAEGEAPLMPEVAGDGTPAAEPAEGAAVSPAGLDGTVPEAQAPAMAQAGTPGEAPAEQAAPEPHQPIISPPVTTIGDQAEGVTTDRLPRIGDEAAEPEPQTLPDEAEGGLRNALAFTNPEGRPVMAVILLDDSAARAALGEIANLPFPVSFVVDATAPDAAEAAGFYRAAGAEVVLALPLPMGAGAREVEAAVETYSALAGEAVAFFVPEASGFQAMGAGARQLASVAADENLGLISFPQGLNTGHKSAVKEGVAAGLVFRTIDGEGQDGPAIRRFLDNAAFRAGQEAGVIVLGHARAETIQALIEWSLGNRVKSVALAPVSAVLSGE